MGGTTKITPAGRANTPTGLLGQEITRGKDIRDWQDPPGRMRAAPYVIRQSTTTAPTNSSMILAAVKIRRIGPTNAGRWAATSCTPTHARSTTSYRAAAASTCRRTPSTIWDQSFRRNTAIFDTPS